MRLTQTQGRKIKLHVLIDIAWALALVAMMLAASQATYGQGGNATINGTVTDQSGGLIAGAKVTIANVLRGTNRAVVTTTDGSYSANFLPVGQYVISFSHPGFKSEARTGIVLTADQVATVNVSLQVGETTQVVEVQGRTEDVATTSGALGQAVNEKAIVELPLNGRNPAALVFQAPGAIDGTITGAISTPGSGSGMPSETAASVNGSRMGGVFYMLDGANHMDSYFLSANPFPNSDATQEFRVLTNNFDAQYGFAPGAVVSIVTKSGSNQWHGDLFEFLRNNHLNSADFFTHVADPLKRNQFGGSIGGPIRKNKLFVFGNYQGTIEHIKISSSNVRVPNNKMLNGDFSDLLAQGIQLHDANGNPYPNNLINPANFDPVVMKLEQGLPRTDDPTGNIILKGRVQDNDTKEFTIKTDYSPNDTHRISFRSYFNNFNRPAATGGGNYLLSDRSWVARNQNYSGDYVWSIRPNLLNNLTVGYNRVNSATLPGLVDSSGKPVSFESLGSKLPDLENPPTIGLIATDGFWISEIPVVQQRHSWIVNDTLSWTKGKHMVVAGVNVLTEYSLEKATWLADPLVFFNDSLTGSFYSDFLLGNLSEVQQGGGEYNPFAGINWAFFGQDSIRLKPNLTVNLGVRWEPYYPAQSTKGGRLGIFWPNHQSTRYPNAPDGMVYPGDPGVPRGGWFANPWKFAPRLSVAWQPRALSNTTIRSAFGMFAVPYDFSFYNHDGSNAPFSPTFDFHWTDPNVKPCQLRIDDPWSCYSPTGGKAPFPPFGISGFVPGASATFVLPVGIPATFDPHFQIGTDQSWNFSIEREFRGDIMLRAAYIGREDYHLATPLELNPGYFSAGGARLRYTNFASVLSYETNTTASYNALQFTFERHFSHGLMVTSNYTRSKQIDSSSLSTISNTGSIGDPFDISWNRGISDLNIPQIWSNYWVWQEPALARYGKLVSTVLGSWEISGIWDLHSGLPFSIQGGNSNNSSLANVGGDRADVTGQPFRVHQGSKNQWLQAYFNTAAFVPNGPGTFGDSPRNGLQGPGYNNADLLFAKNFPFKERYRVQFRWEMFNAFNRTQFGTPDTNPGPGNPTYGQILSTAGKPRQMQVALKLYW